MHQRGAQGRISLSGLISGTMKAAVGLHVPLNSSCNAHGLGDVGPPQ